MIADCPLLPAHSSRRLVGFLLCHVEVGGRLVLCLVEVGSGLIACHFHIWRRCVLHFGRCWTCLLLHQCVGVCQAWKNVFIVVGANASPNDESEDCFGNHFVLLQYLRRLSEIEGLMDSQEASIP